MALSSCNSTKYPASGDSVVTVLSAANEAQPVDSADGWTYVGKDDGEEVTGGLVVRQMSSRGGCEAGCSSLCIVLQLEPPEEGQFCSWY